MAMDEIKLRDYQDHARREVYRSLREHRSTLLVLPTGCGKTIVFAKICKDGADNGKRMLVLAHRSELVEQAAEKIGKVAGCDVAVEQAERKEAQVGGLIDGAPVVVGSVQSMVKRLDRFPADHFNLIIVDECFPAGTLIDGRPIEEIAVGDRVRCFDHDAGSVTTSTVKRLFKSRPSSLCSVRLSHGATINCTAGHPFFVPGRGYVPAALLRPGEGLLVSQNPDVQGVRRGFSVEVPPRVLLGRVQVDAHEGQDGHSAVCRVWGDHDGVGSGWTGSGPHGEDLLHDGVQGHRVEEIEVGDDGAHKQGPRVSADEIEQPDAPRGVPREDVCDPSSHRSSAEGARRERSGAHGDGVDDLEGARVADERHREHWKEAWVGLPVSLQGGRGKPGGDDSDRGGWLIPFDAGAEGSGQEKGSTLALSRVESLEVHQCPGEDVVGRLCPDGFVYNIEVEHHHNYFVEDVLVHNCHHAIAKTYRDIIAHFSGAKVLGVTATPERGDGTALRAVFDDVAFDMSLSNAVTGGWLTPIRSKVIELEHLNLSECRSRAGDLAAGDLDEIMSEVKLLREMAEPTIEHCIGRPTIVFTVTVAHAHVFAQTLREVAEERGLEIVVEALDGTTDKALRKAQVARYQAGEIHILVNCMLFTEGFDAPATACIVMGRPTKSRSLYMQMLGRGTRPLAGTVDGVTAADMMVAIDGHMDAGRIDGEVHAKIIAEVHQGSDAAARRAAIAVSAKTDVLVLDFTGDSGKHDLVQAVDLLGGSALEERLLAEARDRVRNGYDDIFAALAAVRAEHDARVMKVQIRAGNAFALLGVDPPQDRFPTAATQNQKDFLERKLKGVKKGDLKRMTKAEANVLITAIMKRQDANLCTFKQARLLTKHGFDPIAVRGLPFMDASGLISELANNDWKAPKGWGESVGNTSLCESVGGA